jgi:hypothetical protein
MENFLLVINKSDINKLVINRKIDMYYLIITRFVHIFGYKDNDNVFKYRSLLY